jgi:beta-lactamase class A
VDFESSGTIDDTHEMAAIGDSPLNQSRRQFISTGVWTLALTAAPLRQPALGDTVQQLDNIEVKLGGRVGVAAINTGDGARLAHRGDERFALCSTFKWLLAATVLSKHDEKGQILEQRLTFGQKDLLPHSPVAERYIAEGSLPIRELCRAAVQLSDNTAANTLLKFIGGPAELTRYLRGLGDQTTRLDRVEPELNTNLSGDDRDTTTPNAMIATMRTILLGDVLSTASREKLLTWLKGCETGLQRLRAGLPASWAVGDKTGTGDHGAVNDLAIVWPPKRSPILIAAYLSESHATPAALDGAHAQIGTLVAKVVT